MDTTQSPTLPVLPVPEVLEVDGRPCTTSLAIANFFGKNHKEVLRDIRSLSEQCPEDFRERNFALTFRTVPGPKNSERKEPFYNVFFDGFMLLAMGFTGAKALQLKLAYIAAFNAMRDQLMGAVPKNALPPADQSPEQILTAQWDKLCAGLDGAGRKKIRDKIFRRMSRNLGTSDFAEITQEQLPVALELMTTSSRKLLRTTRKSLPLPICKRDQLDAKFVQYQNDLHKNGFRAECSCTITLDAMGNRHQKYNLQVSQVL